MVLAAWTLINGELPPVFLRERHPTWRSRQAPKALCQTIGTWARLAVLLADQGITTLDACTTHMLGEYGRHLRDSGAARITVHSGLSSLTRLWVFDQLSGRPSGIGCPPWETERVDDYLPPATSGGENATDAGGLPIPTTDYRYASWARRVSSSSPINVPLGGHRPGRERHPCPGTHGSRQLLFDHHAHDLRGPRIGTGFLTVCVGRCTPS
ncbi:hypothetical protein [Streptomyces atratus]|uniref:hypothetical protein n=1 Tax=Streptomyces atratus TaxID=1893 RepID=UPI0022575CA0|nr:hypothetical protein [Streptomyces atratus]MCX5345012.1 hypothetical protein [Streptomyces atratus]